MRAKPVMQLEFNELSPVLVDRFIAEGRLPNFKALRDTSACYVTDASDETQLEPWTQWPTLHTGMSSHTHQLHDLGEAGRLGGRGIARELSRNGYKVGVFGAMNVDYGPLNGFVVPDPWNPESLPHPQELTAYTDFVIAAVQESSTNSLDKTKAARFGTFLLTNGISPATVKSVVAQLVDERRGDVAWKRSTILDLIGFDVFCSLVKKHNVAFASFFSNSTAHFMHYFWRNYDAASFSTPPPSTDASSLSDAVPLGYERMDALIGKAMARFPGWRISLATALSQQPWDTDKCTWRPHDMQRVLDLAGISRDSARVQPVMAEQFFVAFDNADAASAGLAALEALTVDGQPLLANELDSDRVRTGCAVMTWNVDNPTITGPGGSAPFRDVFYMIHGVRSGRHHPHGLYWAQSASPARHDEPVPLVDVAPTILSLFDVSAPEYMVGTPLTVEEPVGV